MKKLIIFTFLCFCGCSSVHSPHTIKSGLKNNGPNPDLSVLLRYADTNLWTLPKNAINQIAAAANRICPRDYEPAYICCLRSTNGEEVVVYFEANREYPVPSEATARVTLFFANHREIPCRESFSAGWRTAISGFRVQKSSNLKEMSDLLVVTVATGLFHNIKKSYQYYALLPETSSLCLVRIEDETGHPQCTQYGWDVSHLTIGPVPSYLYYLETYVDFRKYLRKASTAEILRTLLFLGSVHSYPKNGKDVDTPQERLDDIAVLLEKSGVLNELSKHSNPWVREYSDLVLKKVAESKTNTEKNKNGQPKPDGDGKPAP